MEMMRMWKLDIQELADRHIPKPRELLKGEKMLPVTD